jgi:tetratricopeptide (TPR) repeat protein
MDFLLMTITDLFMSAYQKTALLALACVLGLFGVARPVQAQALLPYVLPLDEERLTADGLSLAEDAAQLASFQQYDEALARAQLAAQLAPGEPQILALLGSLYLQVDNSAQAVVTLERAKALDPDNALVWFALGSAYFSEAKYLQAATSLENGLKIEADNANARFDLGNAYYKLNRYSQAIEQYERSISLDETLWPSINNIGLVLYEMGDVPGAIAKWQEALELAPEELRSEPELAIAVAQFSQNQQTAEAIRAATVALERDSRYAEIDFLAENLWGTRLLTATEQFFNTPALRSLLAQL